MPLSFCAAGTTRALSAADAPEDADFAFGVSITDGLLVFDEGDVGTAVFGAAGFAFGAAVFATGFAGALAIFPGSFPAVALRGGVAAGFADCLRAAPGAALRAGATTFFDAGAFFATSGRLPFATGLLATLAAGLADFTTFAFTAGFARAAAFAGLADFVRATALAGFALARGFCLVFAMFVLTL